VLVPNINQFLQNKKILILGFGREGRSTYAYLQKYVPSAKIDIADLNSDLKIKEQNLKLHLGDNYLDTLNGNYDLIIKSPGITLKNINTTPFIKKLTSQADLFLKFYRDQVIGITGTKGKSTVTSLLYHILKSAGKDTLAIGNIGIPAFDVLDKIKKDTLIIYEFSSHQLEFIKTSPYIAVLLNIYPEHLDYYENFTAYKYAKCNIFKFQKYTDYFIYNANDKNTIDLLKNQLLKQEVHAFGENVSPRFSPLSRGDVAKRQRGWGDAQRAEGLIGTHNQSNIAADCAVCQILKIPTEIVTKSIQTFQPLPHRLEYVGKYQEIAYYNDSIATIPEATIAAINALAKNLETIILGGFDRGICYKELGAVLLKSKIKNIILLPDTGYTIQTILNQTKHHKNIKLVATLEDAVTLAKQLTSPGKACLFSPAAASYNQFKNFEQRGDMFKKLAKD
jgi:UDP-N-acetylmuramoyl-L-alanine---L-glutamate ligase